MRVKIGAVIAVVALLCAGCDWTQFAGGANHSNTIYDDGLTTATIGSLVSSTFASTTTTAQVVTANGLVYAQRDGALTAYDATTSGVVWSATLPPGTTGGGAPAVDPGSNTVFVVVAGAANLLLVGYDGAGARNCNALTHTCNPIFIATLGSTPGAATPPVVDSGKIFVNGPGALYAFDAAGQTNCGAWLGMQACSPLWASSTSTSAAGIGPTVSNSVVYDAVSNGGALGAFDEATGNALWTGPVAGSAVTASASISSNGTVFVPAGDVIDVFAGSGCGAASCAPAFALARRAGDAAGQFFSTPATDGATVVATNGNGFAYAWPQIGCSASACSPQAAAAVNTPGAGSFGYAQSPAVTNGVVYLLAQRAVSGVDHLNVVALDEATLASRASWDLGTAGLAPGLTGVSIANGVVYAPSSSGVFTLHPPAAQPLASLSISPLTLRPGFSPSTFDYVIPCAAGTNNVTVDTGAVVGGSVQLVSPNATAAAPTQHADLQLVENEPIVLQATNTNGVSVQYWIRCLPHDFPIVTATPHPAAGSPTPGWYLTGNLALGPTYGAYAMILDQNGTPVWYRRTNGALDVTPMGTNTLAYMSLATTIGFGIDPSVAFNVDNLSSGATSTIATVGVPTDLHELETLPNGDHLLLSYPLKTGVDLTGLPGTPAPGPNSTIADCEVQDVNAQGQLVWKWDASDHFDAATESTLPAPATLNGQTVYDVFHCNSVDADASGNLLVSARNMNAVFEIRRSDGKVLWKMGGTPVNKDGAEIVHIQNYNRTSISAQHDARWQPNGDVSVFDDQTYGSGPASATEFSLDLGAGTATPVFEFSAPSGLKSAATGSFRRYGDGHSVIAWGLGITVDGNLMSEIDASGNDVLDMSFPAGNAAYRVIKAPTNEFDVNVLRLTAGS